MLRDTDKFPLNAADNITNKSTIFLALSQSSFHRIDFVYQNSSENLIRMALVELEAIW